MHRDKGACQRKTTLSVSKLTENVNVKRVTVSAAELTVSQRTMSSVPRNFPVFACKLKGVLLCDFAVR